MGFWTDVFGGGRKPKDLPPVPTPAGDALQAPLSRGLRGEGFDPASEGRSRRLQTRAVNESFVGGERDFNSVLNRTLQRGDIAPREVAGKQRLRGRNLRLERIEQSGAAINFEQTLQAQDIGLNAAGTELSRNQQIATATTNSRLRRIFAPDFNEGISQGVGEGLGFISAQSGQGEGGIGQPGQENSNGSLSPGQQGPPIGLASPGVQNRFSGSPSPVQAFSERFSLSQANSFA